MAAYNLSPIGNGWQFFGASGANIPPNLPLNGGFINTFAAGTNTPLATFSNNLGSIQNSTTMQLGPDGRPTTQIWFASGVAYKFQLTDSSGYQIWIEDNLLGINDSGSSVTSEWVSSGAVPTYSSGTVFTTPGNTTGTFQVGRRVQATVTAGTVYGTIVTSVFGVSTTVTLVMDAGMALDAGLTVVNVALLGGTFPSQSPNSLILPACSFSSSNNLTSNGFFTTFTQDYNHGCAGTTSSANGIIQVQLPGIYLVSFHVHAVANNNGSATFRIYKNSVGVAATLTYIGLVAVAGVQDVSLMYFMSLAANDALQIALDTISGATNNANCSSFQVAMI